MINYTTFEEDNMIFKLESLSSWVIHSLTNLKLKHDDPIKVCFDGIKWEHIFSRCFHLYSDIGAPAYNPVSMFKALLLIYLGQAVFGKNKKVLPQSM